MADNDLPDNNAAPNGDAPQTTPKTQTAPSTQQPSGPATKPADTTSQSTITLDSFSEDEQKYLRSQGVTDLTSADAIKKIIHHAQSSQKTAADIKNQLDKANLTFKESETDNPLTTPVSSQPNTSGAIDPVTAYTLSSNLANNFPELKDDLTSGKFYTDMQAQGLPLVIDGKVNLSGILSYGKFAQQVKQNEAKAEELSKPGAGTVPDVNTTLPAQPADDAPMTSQLARAILFSIAQGTPNARQEEAARYIREHPGKK